MKVYIIQELVSNEASGAMFSNGTVVLNNKEKAKEIFSSYIDFYRNKPDYYNEVFVKDDAAKFTGGGVEYVMIKFTENDTTCDIVEFSI